MRLRSYRAGATIVTGSAGHAHLAVGSGRRLAGALLGLGREVFLVEGDGLTRRAELAWVALGAVATGDARLTGRAWWSALAGAACE